MATTLQFALSNPTPGMEGEFNRWYGGDHLVHGVETPGILAGQRFRRVDGPWPPGKHDYLMIWEMDDPAFALAELAKVKGGDKMPISPAIDMTTVQPPTMWRRATVRSAVRHPVDTSSHGMVVLGLYKAAEGDDAEFEKAMLTGGLATLADLPGVVSAEYLTLADEQIRGNARKFPHGLLIELADETTGIGSLERPLASLAHSDPDNWLAVAFRSLGPRVAKGMEHI